MLEFYFHFASCGQFGGRVELVVLHREEVAFVQLVGLALVGFYLDVHGCGASGFPIIIGQCDVRDTYGGYVHLLRLILPEHHHFLRTIVLVTHPLVAIFLHLSVVGIGVIDGVLYTKLEHLKIVCFHSRTGLWVSYIGSHANDAVGGKMISRSDEVFVIAARSCGKCGNGKHCQIFDCLHYLDYFL